MRWMKKKKKLFPRKKQIVVRPISGVYIVMYTAHGTYDHISLALTHPPKQIHESQIVIAECWKHGNPLQQYNFSLVRVQLFFYIF